MKFTDRKSYYYASIEQPLDTYTKVNEFVSISPTEIARETGVSHSFVWHIIKKNLILKTLRRREVQLLSIINKNKQLSACWQLKVHINTTLNRRMW